MFSDNEDDDDIEDVYDDDDNLNDSFIDDRSLDKLSLNDHPLPASKNHLTKTELKQRVKEDRRIKQQQSKT